MPESRRQLRGGAEGSVCDSRMDACEGLKGPRVHIRAHVWVSGDDGVGVRIDESVFKGAQRERRSERGARQMGVRLEARLVDVRSMSEGSGRQSVDLCEGASRREIVEDDETEREGESGG